jgi:hypothetical protein
MSTKDEPAFTEQALDTLRDDLGAKRIPVSHRAARALAVMVLTDREEYPRFAGWSPFYLGAGIQRLIAEEFKTQTWISRQREKVLEARERSVNARELNLMAFEAEIREEIAAKNAKREQELVYQEQDLRRRIRQSSENNQDLVAKIKQLERDVSWLSYVDKERKIGMLPE